MRLRTLSWMLLLAAALAAGAWWARDHPRLRALWPQALPALPQAVLPAPPAVAAGARKCRGAAGLVYTDGACPPGTREETLQGALSVLPAVRPAAPADTAASAQTPLRRLAGPDDSAAQRERVLEQAMGR
jgi:hypothetical protein